MTRSRALSVLFAAVTLCLATGSSVLAAKQARVTGGGRYIGDFGLTVVSVNAIQHKDGSVSGKLEQFNPENGGSVHGTITCLDFVNDTTVLVSGVLTHTRHIPEGGEWVVPGLPFVLLLRDNGEGSAAAADLVTPWAGGFVGEPFPCHDPQFIAEVYDFLVNVVTAEAELISGNVQISR